MVRLHEEAAVLPQGVIHDKQFYSLVRAKNTKRRLWFTKVALHSTPTLVQLAQLHVDPVNPALSSAMRR
jgi:hypothetical protein